MSDIPESFAATIERFSGFADDYDYYRPQPPQALFLDGFSHCTGLPAGGAQIVTCMQSLHWMEPRGTFEEARRLLCPGGVFAAVDYDWPPVTGSWKADLAWRECNDRAVRLEATIALDRRRGAGTSRNIYHACSKAASFDSLGRCCCITSTRATPSVMSACCAAKAASWIC